MDAPHEKQYMAQILQLKSVFWN